MNTRLTEVTDLVSQVAAANALYVGSHEHCYATVASMQAVGVHKQELLAAVDAGLVTATPGDGVRTHATMYRPA